MSRIMQNYILPAQEKGKDLLEHPDADRIRVEDRRFQIELDSSLKNESQEQEPPF